MSVMETREIEMSISFGATAVKCPHCNEAFVIMYIPTDIDSCDGEVGNNWWNLGNPDSPLYCPLCGKRMAKETEDKSS